MTKTIYSIIILTIIGLTSFGQEKKESLKINLPEQYSWKIESDKKEGPIRTMNLVPANETITKWTIMATMIRNEEEKFVPMEIAMNNAFSKARKNSSKAMVTLIERDKDAKNHWIIFKIESMTCDDKTLESKLYYVIQGDDALYSNSISIKEKSLTDEFVKKWTGIFEKSELEYNADQSIPGFRIGMINP